MTLTIRTALADDPDWVIAAHGELYAREFGFDDGFRIGIADKMQSILGKADPFTRLWIAQSDGVRAGSI